MRTAHRAAFGSIASALVVLALAGCELSVRPSASHASAPIPEPSVAPSSPTRAPTTAPTPSTRPRPQRLEVGCADLPAAVCLPLAAYLVDVHPEAADALEVVEAYSLERQPATPGPSSADNSGDAIYGVHARLVGGKGFLIGQFVVGGDGSIRLDPDRPPMTPAVSVHGAPISCADAASQAACLDIVANAAGSIFGTRPALDRIEVSPYDRPCAPSDAACATGSTRLDIATFWFAGETDTISVAVAAASISRPPVVRSATAAPTEADAIRLAFPTVGGMTWPEFVGASVGACRETAGCSPLVVRPDLVVWVVTFEIVAVICPPATPTGPAPCLAPRRLTATVVLDGATGDRLMGGASG